MSATRYIIVVLCTLVFALTGKSQCISINLIKNPGLEDYTCCPTDLTMITCANYWYQPLIYGSTSDYYNICGIDSLVDTTYLPAFQQNFFGNGYAGIAVDSYYGGLGREYIQGTLSEPLITGQCYFCEFWVKLNNFKNSSPFAALDALGIYFSDTLPKKTIADTLAFFLPAQINNPTGRIITDTSHWTQITDTFIAVGGEKYFTVGTFKQENEINKTYFFSPPFDESYYFFDNFYLCPCEDTVPPPVVEKPNVVYVPNVFSPNNDGKNDKFNVHGNNINDFHIRIYDRWGEMMFETYNIHEGWNGRYKDVGCPEGVYFYFAEITFLDGSKSLRKGNVTLVR